jgi:crossover junction endodeoxyribonuclease RuvC
VIVLGIDPGTASTGYGVVARSDGRMVALDGGVIATSPSARLELRLAEIHERVLELIDAHAPDAMAVESLFFGVNVRSASAVAHARGAVLTAAGRRGLPCQDYTPQQIKGAVCGSGRAEKAQVQAMVQRLLALTAAPRPDHAADALAVALCHVSRAPLQAAVERVPALGFERA